MFLNLMIQALWLAFIAYWLISAIGTKKYAPGSRRRGFVIRAVLIVFILLMLQSPDVRHYIAYHRISSAPAVRLSGVILCAAGMGFAVWARVHLGRNWGVPMSLRQGHELVTSGPYRIVRHPIYTGILLAALGSGLTAGAWWLAAFVIYYAYFFYSATIEEKEMLRQFPDQYAEYKRRTRGMIIPS